ncbi:DNA repair protein RecN [Clostridium kluyveri]|uniref:DNA repair protein RecN n=1 Tax=Clostridium kluyveri TaxID=1534 RepID=A0A1L5F6K3_CLOKL|nr:DNA repair protein RecN [Clostridium kluyveri]APM38617.1 DNA repair protein RecN [Clostridium kluyveri]UZQ50918.1 DNA repair protein RecN [Clostridium kluyveri]
MLLQLNINNFALIEKLIISFESGFNILSGETGAGKSILIDAINYVMGSKFNKDLIRTGKNKTFVEAVFTIENPKTFEILNEEDISGEENMVIISRESFQSGRTIAKVNGKSVLISNLRKISSTLLDIHGQHDSQNLLAEENHINYLDYYGESVLHSPLKDYRKKYESLNDVKRKIYEISEKEGDREKIVDFLKYQIDEIDSANLVEGEEEKLNEKFKIFSNREKINSVINDCYIKLYSGKEGQISVYDSLGVIIKQLNSIKNIMPEIDNIHNSFESIYYDVEGNIEDLRSIKDNFYYDVNELEYINNRINEINNFKNKYGSNIENILNYRDKMKAEYEEMKNMSQVIEKLNLEKIKLEELLKLKGEEIHKIRSRLAEDLEKKIKNELDFVGLEKSKFKIQVKLEDKFTSKGMDDVKFYIATNPGEPLKPLEKIVSGGELSRIMLALKTVFIDKDFIPSVIFDEIDTGISGRIAQCVAEKMYAISKKHQVFCVTHLPQIACMSDIHYWVSKQVIDNMTYTKVKKMDKREKECEIARMIGGSEVTKITLEHARELINMADLKKDKIK